MAKKKKGQPGLKQTSKAAMNKLKKSQNIAIVIMIVVLAIGVSVLVVCYYYPTLNSNTGKTAEQGQSFTVKSLSGSAQVDVSVETNAREPPEFAIISDHNFKQISPTLTVPNKYTDPGSVEQIRESAEVYQTGKKDFRYNRELDNDEWFVITITNQTEGGVPFNMIYDIQVFSLRPLILPLALVVIIIVCAFFAYILVLNSRLKQVQEKVSTQRLLKAQMDMVRNFILQSSGASQPFAFSGSPYKSMAGESIPRDAMPLAIAQGDAEIVECYACNELITVNSRDRPLIVACPNCGVKSQVVEDEGEPGVKAPSVKQTLPPAEAEMKMLPAGNPEVGESAPPSELNPTPTPAPTENTA